MSNQNLEPYLRIAISNIRNAHELTTRVPYSQSRQVALGHMEDAVEKLQMYAAINDIELLPSMKT